MNEDRATYVVKGREKLSGVELRYVHGSIFEGVAAGADGIAIFIPCGLTALRADAKDFLRNSCELVSTDGDLILYKMKSGGASGEVSVVCDTNPRQRLYEAQNIPVMVAKSLELLSSRGSQHIAINGIRIKNGGYDHAPERKVIEAVKNWCEVNECSFMIVDFVDRRDGFNKAMSRMA